jgi:hypothetical protein
MQLLKSLAFLAAALPIVLSASVPPPEMLCKLGTKRCHDNNLEECGSHGNYFLVQTCTGTEYCAIDIKHPNAPGQCIPQGCIQTPCSEKTKRWRGAPEALYPCGKIGDQQCIGSQIQECTTQYRWLNTEGCDTAEECVEKDGRAHCAIIAAHSPSACNPEPCTPGERKCSNDAYALYLCGEDKAFHMEKKCLTPGDCKTDGPGQAHCERGGIDPPKARRQTNSTHGDYACDKNRRFMFECTSEGKWMKPYQCSRAGACQPVNSTPEYPAGRLYCEGFPKFLYPDGDNRICETVGSCEFMRYRYCMGVGTHLPKMSYTHTRCRTAEVLAVFFRSSSHP